MECSVNSGLQSRVLMPRRWTAPHDVHAVDVSCRHHLRRVIRQELDAEPIVQRLCHRHLTLASNVAALHIHGESQLTVYATQHLAITFSVM
jgi:hypothetical protein